MLFLNKTNFTSEPINNNKEVIVEKYLIIDGPGPVSIEQLGSDDVWRTVPELVFEESQAQIFSIKRGYWRVVISGGPTTVEIV